MLRSIPAGHPRGYRKVHVCVGSIRGYIQIRDAGCSPLCLIAELLDAGDRGGPMTEADQETRKPRPGAPSPASSRARRAGSRHLGALLNEPRAKFPTIVEPELLPRYRKGLRIRHLPCQNKVRTGRWIVVRGRRPTTPCVQIQNPNRLCSHMRCVASRPQI